jgi:hypothetical protein
MANPKGRPMDDKPALTSRPGVTTPLIIAMVLRQIREAQAEAQTKALAKS